MKLGRCHLLPAILDRAMDVITINLNKSRTRFRLWKGSTVKNGNLYYQSPPPDMEKRTRFLISQAFLFLCICGGIGHIIKMTMTYFEYKTITRITLDKRQLIDAPTLVACVRYLEVMDFWSLGKKMGISYDANQSHDQIELLFADKVTIKDIFEHTPPADQILKRCTYRRKQDRRVLLQEASDCGYFRMVKFVMQSYICYSMMPHKKSPYSIDDLASSYNFEHTIFVVEWDQIFTRAVTLFVILGDNTYPYRSKLFGSFKLIGRGHNRSMIADVIVRNKITKVILEPKPYDTSCSKTFSLGDKTTCLIEKMRECGLQRIPNTEIITEPYDLKQVQIRDELNETMRLKLDQIYDQCDKETDGEKCFYTISETDARFYESDNNTFMTFRIMSPMASNTLIESKPAFQMFEYMLYISSCFGIWFGLSVRDFDPVKVWPKVRRRLQRWSKIVPVSDQMTDARHWTHLTPPVLVGGVRPMPSHRLAILLNGEHAISGKM